MTDPVAVPGSPVSRRAGGVRGASPPTRRVSCCACFTESGHDVTVVPTAAALHFVGQATWAALSGKPVATDVWTDAHEVPHVRLGQSADLVVVAPATADLLARAVHGQGRRPAHQRPAHRPVPGGVRPGHAHRDVGAPRHPGQRRDAAGARRAGHRAGRRPAHRRRHRQGPAARARGDLRGLPGRPVPRRRILDLAGPHGRGLAPAAPASRSTRCASSATVPPGCRATRWRVPPPPAAPT